MAQKEYQLLPQTEDSQLSSPIPPQPNRLAFLLPTLVTFLILSLSANTLLLRNTLSTPPPPPFVTSQSSDISKYAKIPRNVPNNLHQDGTYTSHNRTVAIAAWDEVRIDLGMVALPDEFVEEHDLMPAQRFPWDADKGIYLINAWHNLHCLVSSSNHLLH